MDLYICSYLKVSSFFIGIMSLVNSKWVIKGKLDRVQQKLWITSCGKREVEKMENFMATGKSNLIVTACLALRQVPNRKAKITWQTMTTGIYSLLKFHSSSWRLQEPNLRFQDFTEDYGYFSNPRRTYRKFKCVVHFTDSRPIISYNRQKESLKLYFLGFRNSSQDNLAKHSLIIL